VRTVELNDRLLNFNIINMSNWKENPENYRGSLSSFVLPGVIANTCFERCVTNRDQMPTKEEGDCLSSCSDKVA
jgi:hypothetical protein